MHIQVDTREKAKALKPILETFDKNGVKWHKSKLYVGDYMNMEKPLLFIDRKQNIAEIAQNATSEHDRVKRELERLKEIDGRMIFLIEQNRIGDRPVTELSDVMFWKSQYGVVNGLQVYRILNAWKHKYNIDFVFCHKNSTGKKIIELLEGKDD